MCTEFVNKLFVGFVKQVVSEAGRSVEEELLRHNLSELFYLENGEPIKASTAHRAWALIRHYLGAETNSIDLAQAYYHPAMLGSLGMGLQCSASLRDAIQRIVNHAFFFSGSSLFELVESPDTVGLQITPNVSDEFLCVDNVNLAIAFLYLYLRDVYPGILEPKSVVLMGEGELKNARFYQRFYRAPVTIHSERIGIYLSRRTAELALPTANAQLASWQDRFTENAIAQLYRDKGIVSVKDEIRRCLEEGREPVCQEIAYSLNLSQRSFQRKLKEQGTTFKQLISDVRKSLALEYLSQSTSTVNDTAFRLGFSDHSSFARAFRRWYGKTPTEFQMTMEQ